MGKLNRIWWPLCSNFVQLRWLLPGLSQAVTADLGRAAELLAAPRQTLTALALLPVHLPLFPFIRLFRNLSHLSIYPLPRPAPPLDNLWPHYGKALACTVVHSHKQQTEWASKCMMIERDKRGEGNERERGGGRGLRRSGCISATSPGDRPISSH